LIGFSEHELADLMAEPGEAPAGGRAVGAHNGPAAEPAVAAGHEARCGVSKCGSLCRVRLPLERPPNRFWNRDAFLAPVACRVAEQEHCWVFSDSGDDAHVEESGHRITGWTLSDRGGRVDRLRSVYLAGLQGKLSGLRQAVRQSPESSASHPAQADVWDCEGRL
jgi:hypothetical protein